MAAPRDARARHRRRRTHPRSSAWRSSPALRARRHTAGWMRVCAARCCGRADALGRARTDEWFAGAGTPVPPAAAAMLSAGAQPRTAVSPRSQRRVLARARSAARTLAEGRGSPRLFAARGRGVPGGAVAPRMNCAGAPSATRCPTSSTATSTTPTSACITAASAPSPRDAAPASLRGPAYRLDLTEIARRTREAWEAQAPRRCACRGASIRLHRPHLPRDRGGGEGGRARTMHVHAFSPLEITHGAQTLGLLAAAASSRELRAAGLSTLPGHRGRDPRR